MRGPRPPPSATRRTPTEPSTPPISTRRPSGDSTARAVSRSWTTGPTTRPASRSTTTGTSKYWYHGAAMARSTSTVANRPSSLVVTTLATGVPGRSPGTRTSRGPCHVEPLCCHHRTVSPDMDTSTEPSRAERIRSCSKKSPQRDLGSGSGDPTTTPVAASIRRSSQARSGASGPTPAVTRAVRPSSTNPTAYRPADRSPAIAGPPSGTIRPVAGSTRWMPSSCSARSREPSGETWAGPR